MDDQQSKPDFNTHPLPGLSAPSPDHLPQPVHLCCGDLLPGGAGVPQLQRFRVSGDGMPHEQVSDLFLPHGESWKRTGRFSPNINRPLHGQLGRGRFLVYGIAERVEWRSVSANGEALSETVIHGTRGAPNEFTFDGSWPTSGPTGTTVRMEARQTSLAPSAASARAPAVHQVRREQGPANEA